MLKTIKKIFEGSKNKQVEKKIKKRPNKMKNYLIIIIITNKLIVINS